MADYDAQWVGTPVGRLFVNSGQPSQSIPARNALGLKLSTAGDYPWPLDDNSMFKYWIISSRGAGGFFLELQGFVTVGGVREKVLHVRPAASRGSSGTLLIPRVSEASIVEIWFNTGSTNTLLRIGLSDDYAGSLIADRSTAKPDTSTP